jgi:hypothetical protein
MFHHFFSSFKYYNFLLLPIALMLFWPHLKPQRNTQHQRRRSDEPRVAHAQSEDSSQLLLLPQRQLPGQSRALQHIEQIPGR